MSKYRPTLLPLDLYDLTKKELIERIHFAENLLSYFQRDHMRNARRFWRRRKEANYWRDACRDEKSLAYAYFHARSFLRSDERSFPRDTKRV